MRSWVKQARKGHDTDLRLLLRDYILVLVNTGIRAGTEAMNLQWKNIAFFENEGKRYLSLNVIGKTQKYREVIVRHRVARYLQRIQERNAAFNDKTFEEVIKLGSNEYVFRMNEKDMTTAFGRVFKRMLTQAKLLVDKRNGIERTLYSCRHTYATMTLTDTKITTYVLAKHMGTSEAMIKQHYEHIEMRGKANEIAGAGNIEDALRKTRAVRKG
jgi:integrase